MTSLRTSAWEANVGKVSRVQSFAVSDLSKFESAIWSCDVGLPTPCVDRYQMTIKLISTTKDLPCKGGRR